MLSASGATVNAFSVGSSKVASKNSPTIMRSAPLPTFDPLEQSLHLEKVAAKLSAEAEAIESQGEQERHEQAEKVFESLDENHDGELSFEELRSALEATLKEELSEEEVAMVIDSFEDNLFELAGQVHLLTSGGHN